MNILLDMNLSPDWVEILQSAGFPTRHWSEVGEITAPDHVIMSWALVHDYVVFTHDLDFGAILAATNAAAPSVFQVRVQDVMPEKMRATIIQAFQQFEEQLLQGALVTLDMAKVRVRVLPLR